MALDVFDAYFNHVALMLNYHFIDRKDHQSLPLYEVFEGLFLVRHLGYQWYPLSRAHSSHVRHIPTSCPLISSGIGCSPRMSKRAEQ